MADTITVCEDVGIATVGAGLNSNDASRVLYQQVKGSTVAIINVAEHEFCIAQKESPGANPLNLVSNYYQIAEAKAKADYIIVIVHWWQRTLPATEPCDG